MIGGYGGNLGYAGLFENKKPGEVVFAVLNPIGWLAQGNPTTSKIERVLHPISPSFFYRKKTGGQFQDKVADLQADAHAQIEQAEDFKPAAVPPPSPTDNTGLLIGASVLAGAIVVLAAHFSTRSR